jgi:RNA polymerase sigma-70 factor (ECF subfamily)
MSFWTRDPFNDLESLIDSVYAYVAYRIGAGARAEDVTSEVFERALRYRKTYDASRGTPIAWFLGIARRVLADEKPFELSDAPDEPAAGDLEADVVRHLTLTAALAELDTRDRELIALRYGADLTAKEIARAYGLRTNTVEVALHRALGRLRLHFADSDDMEAPLRSALQPVRV